MADMARHGILATPGMMIEAKVVHASGLPKAETINSWLKS